MAGIALGIVAAVSALGSALAPAMVVWDLFGTALIVVGMFGWGLMPENRSGTLLGCSGFLAVASIIALDHQHATIQLLGSAAAAASVAPLAHVAMALPRGRVQTRHARVFVATTYVVLCALVPLLYLSFSPNPIGATQSRSLPSSAQSFASLVAALLLAWLIVLLARKWRTAARPTRRVVGPALTATAFAACAGLAAAVATLVRGGDAPDPMEVVLLGAALLPVPAGFLLSFIRARIAAPNVGEFLVGVSKRSRGESLRDLIGLALADPGLEIGYWARTTRTFVDESGRPVPAEAGPGSTRASTLIGGRGEPVAVLLHEPAVLDDEGRVAAVATVARVALENERLHAEVRAQLELARQSRERIVRVADGERRRIERDLHDGAQQRLVALAVAIGLVEERLDRCRDSAAQALIDQAGRQARSALVALRQLAQGLHPALLSEAGLGPALTSLAERMPVPTRILAAPARRFSPTVEATAYVVVAEALGNVAKHADASSATVTARHEGTEILVRVTDDGRGGARLIGGGGLAGLEDRVAALGGSLEVQSRPTATRVTARIPCG